ncbi:MAG: LptE family protein [Flavobacteriales bacterium]|nr:LptE family protein [Flavobacteriales bacterium]HPF67119.1 LptE family protein [Flavobacteriales bacterium]HRW89023.1 LptE family protein [Flavobacteriales bacterium]
MAHPATRRSHKALLVLALALVFTACRVSYSFTGADIPKDARTVSIDLFDARAPLASPRVAQVFTETLRDLMQAQTPLNLTGSDGDVQYAGEIVGYDVQPVNIQSNETAALNRLTMTVKVRYVNTLDTDKNSESTFSRFADYDSGQDLTSVEETLVREISDQLVQDIFDRTLGSW